MSKIQIKSIYGKLIFEYECENNTIRKTVEKAVFEKISLRLADLHSADLHSANLHLADLRSADLRLADLRSANLCSADLRSANLCSADLHSANLRLADLHSADLHSANLHSADLRSADLRLADLHSAKNKERAFIPLFCKWSFSIFGDKIQIGCEKRTIEEWDKFFESKEVLSTQRNTEYFKQIEAIYLACKAYLTHLNK
jgi:hypothetical protein